MNTEFPILAAQHRSRAWRAARRVTRDDGLAEDAVQEALVVAWLRLPELSDPDRFGEWLAGIAGNVARGMIRSRVRGARLAERAHEAGWIPTPEELVERADTRACVRRVVGGLSPGTRDAIAAHHLDEQPVRQVARRVGASPDAVKQRVSRGRRQLRMLLRAVLGGLTAAWATLRRSAHAAALPVAAVATLTLVAATGSDGAQAARVARALVTTPLTAPEARFASPAPARVPVPVPVVELEVNVTPPRRVHQVVEGTPIIVEADAPPAPTYVAEPVAPEPPRFAPLTLGSARFRQADVQLD